jgi:hypothetical protein
MTQFEAARQGIITEVMRRVAERENTTAELIRAEVARGRLVIPPTSVISPAVPARRPPHRRRRTPRRRSAIPAPAPTPRCG